MTYMARRQILIEISEGRVGGALLENGFLDCLVEAGADVHILTPGARFEPFVQRYARKGVRFSYISVDTPLQIRHARLAKYEAALGRRLTLRGYSKTRRALWRFLGERLAVADGHHFQDLLQQERPDCFVSTNMVLGYGRGLTAICRRLDIPTVGNVFSWDHPFFEQPVRPDRLTCWSPMVRDWLVAFAGFEADRITITGVPAFDAYFDPAGTWSREQTCRSLGLDPNRPMLLFATLGYFKPHWDETGSFRALMQAIDAGDIPGNPQVVLRLHPLSVDYHFEEYRGHPGVVFSRFTGSCPGMRWFPSRDEVILAGNLLRHADVCISPGSTMTVEAAIFDTPTVVPVFNQFIPEENRNFFNAKWKNRHFRFLIDNNLIPILESPEEMVVAVRRAMSDRSWLSDARRMIRDKALGPMDGAATRRFADVVLNTATRGKA